MAGEFYISGLTNTGFDYEAYLENLANLWSIPIQQMKDRQTELIAKSTAALEIYTALTDFSSPIDTLQDSSSYNVKTASISDSDIATVSVDSGAQIGTYSLEVVTLATQSSFVISTSSVVSDADSDLTSSSATLTINYNKDGSSTSISINYQNKSLNEIAEYINQNSDDLTATVINQGTSSSPDYRLIVSSNGVGSGNQINSVSDTGSIFNTDDSDHNRPTEETNTVTDAEIKINGLSATNTTSNTFTDVLTGVDITISKQTTSAVTLTISNDFSSVENALNSIITAYNNTKTTIDNNIAEGAALQGETSLSIITSSIFRVLSDYLGEQNLLDSSESADTATGQISLDTEQLNTLLNSDNFDAYEFFYEFANSLEDTVDIYTESMQNRSSTYQELSQDLADDIQEKTEQLQEKIERLRIQYAQVDLYLSQMQSLQSQIQSFASALTGNTTSD